MLGNCVVDHLVSVSRGLSTTTNGIWRVTLTSFFEKETLPPVIYTYCMCFYSHVSVHDCCYILACIVNLFIRWCGRRVLCGVTYEYWSLKDKSIDNKFVNLQSYTSVSGKVQNTYKGIVSLVLITKMVCSRQSKRVKKKNKKIITFSSWRKHRSLNRFLIFYVSIYKIYEIDCNWTLVCFTT